MSFFEAMILAIVEGLTEFLPISSTGHMILVTWLMGTDSTHFVKTYTIVIQLGAICSVLVLYFKRFFQSIDFYLKLCIAFFPAAVVGYLAGDFIDSLLENVVVVAFSLIIGGVVLLFFDYSFKIGQKQKTSYTAALTVGFFQCLALVPGVSRSAATIIGGLIQGWSRKHAAEFSFFLAVPTMLAATAYKLLKSFTTFQQTDFQLLIFGNVVAFVVALIAIKTFISILSKYGLKWFGYYRIAAGLIILWLVASGYNLQMQ